MDGFKENQEICPTKENKMVKQHKLLFYEKSNLLMDTYILHSIPLTLSEASASETNRI